MKNAFFLTILFLLTVNLVFSMGQDSTETNNLRLEAGDIKSMVINTDRVEIELTDKVIEKILKMKFSSVSQIYINSHVVEQNLITFSNKTRAFHPTNAVILFEDESGRIMLYDKKLYVHLDFMKRDKKEFHRRFKLIVNNLMECF